MSFISEYTLSDVMNSIRESASPSYQERVPVLSDDNFRQFASGVSIPVFFNEWHNQLINRIGLTVLKNKSWDNPLAFLKKGSLAMGETIQEIFTDLIEAQRFESMSDITDAGKVWKTAKPDVYSAYHVKNRQDMYEVSYSYPRITEAFTSPRALQQFILSIYESLYTSDSLDEFLYMKELLKLADDKGLFHYVSLDPTKSVDQLLIEVRAMSNKLGFISDKYNAMGVKQHTPKNEQVILISADLDAIIDVASLASAFNMDKKEFLARRIVLDDLGVEGAMLALVSKDWFMVYDSVRELRDLSNPRTLEIKYFYHVHQWISTSRFENAILFTTNTIVPSDKLTASLKGVSGGVDKGQWYEIEHELSFLDETLVPPAQSKVNVLQAVGYKLSDNAVSGTKIENGRIYIDLNQTVGFEIRVFDLQNHAIYKDITVTLA